MHLSSVMQGCVMKHIVLGGLSSQGCTGLTPAEAAPRPKTWGALPDPPALQHRELEEPALPAQQSVQTRASGQPPRLSRHQLPDGGKEHSPHSPEEQRREARTPAIWLHSPYTWPSQLRQYSPAQYTETRKGQSTSPRGTGTLTPDLRARVTATLHLCKTESSGPTRWDGVLL